jgi:hypothetical protein
MPLPGCQIEVWVNAPTAFVRISGRAAAEGSRDFKLLITRLRDRGITCYGLDLSRCLLMDSTFSGVLAALAVAPLKFSIHGANSRVLDLLDNLGVLPLVTVLDSLPLDAANVSEGEGTESVSVGGHSKDEMASCCLEAHRFLMALKPENAAKFKAVTEILEQQLQEPVGSR